MLKWLLLKERTGIIPIARGVFRAFLMNSEDHPIPERILALQSGVLYVALENTELLLVCFCSIWHHLSAYPVGVRELPEKQVVLL